MAMFILIIVLILIVTFMFALLSGSQRLTQTTNMLNKMGLTYAQFIVMDKYLCGHPTINDPTQNTFIIAEGEKLSIYNENPFGVGRSGVQPRVIGEIPLKAIEDIQVEDATTVERRLTVGRLAVLGIFAFALKKEKKTELAYVTIKWKQGRFQHETIFEFDKGHWPDDTHALSKANTVRNQLINASMTQEAASGQI